MKNCIIDSIERINTGRQNEIDLAKAAMLFLMPFVHITIMAMPDEALENGIPFFLDSIVGGPFGAPMFMMAMGVGVVYSSKRTPQEFLVKGVGIYVSGIILSFVAEGIPRIIAYNITGDKEFSLELIYKIFGDDILQFAGISMIFTAFLFYLKVSDEVLVIIAVILSLISNFFYETDLGDNLANITAGQFIGTQDSRQLIDSAFPFFNWFIVFVAGYIFAKYLAKITDKKEFYKKILIITLPLSAVYLAFSIYYRSGMFSHGQDCYYHARSYEIVMAICFNLAMFAIYYFIYPKLPKIIKKIVFIYSDNILQYYCIHLVICTFGCFVLAYSILGMERFTLIQTGIVSLAISIVSIFLANLYTKKIKTVIRG